MNSYNYTLEPTKVIQFILYYIFSLRMRFLKIIKKSYFYLTSLNNFLILKIPLSLIFLFYLIIIIIRIYINELSSENSFL